MTDSTDNPKRFEDLVRDLLDGTVSDSVNHRQIEAAVRRDPALLKEYLDQVELDTFLGWEFGKEEQPEEKITKISESKPAGSGLATRLAVAAMIAFFFGVGMFSAARFFRSGPSAEKGADSTVAVLIDSEDCVWGSSETTPLSFGTAFQKGETISIASGIGRFAMEGNAGIAIEGPAEIELVSSQEARVVYGRVSAYAPEEAIGFRLLTPDVEIVDLGTRFAARVERDGKTEVHVFEGEVSVKGRSRNAAGEVITEGQARLYSAGGKEGRRIAVAPDSFTEPPALEQLLGTTGPGQWKPLPFLKSGGKKQPHPGWIVGQDFSGGTGNPARLPSGFGFGKNVWMISSSYARVIPRVLSHSGETVAGGYFLVRGRESSEVSVPNRLRLKLSKPLPLNFYFAIRARYKGLDKDDFFALWIDSLNRDDSTHSYVPNIGIRKSEFYSRLDRDRLAEGKIRPKDNTPFFLVGHYSMNESTQRETVSIWLNPTAPEPGSNAVPQPDSMRVENNRIKQPPVLQHIGIRMGKYTEVSDELLIEKILITSDWKALFD